MGQLNFQWKRLFEFFQANLRATHRCTIQTLFRVENYLTKISHLRNVTPTCPLALWAWLISTHAKTPCWRGCTTNYVEKLILTGNFLRDGLLLIGDLFSLDRFATLSD